MPGRRTPLNAGPLDGERCMAEGQLKRLRRKNRLLAAASIILPFLAFGIVPESSFGLGLFLFFTSFAVLTAIWYASVRCPSCKAAIHLHRKGFLYGPHVPAVCPACGHPIDAGVNDRGHR